MPIVHAETNYDFIYRKFIEYQDEDDRYYEIMSAGETNDGGFISVLYGDLQNHIIKYNSDGIEEWRKSVEANASLDGSIKCTDVGCYIGGDGLFLISEDGNTFKQLAEFGVFERNWMDYSNFVVDEDGGFSYYNYETNQFEYYAPDGQLKYTRERDNYNRLTSVSLSNGKHVMKGIDGYYYLIDKDFTNEKLIELDYENYVELNLIGNTDENLIFAVNDYSTSERETYLLLADQNGNIISQKKTNVGEMFGEYFYSGKNGLLFTYIKYYDNGEESIQTVEVDYYDFELNDYKVLYLENDYEVQDDFDRFMYEIEGHVPIVLRDGSVIFPENYYDDEYGGYMPSFVKYSPFSNINVANESDEESYGDISFDVDDISKVYSGTVVNINVSPKEGYILKQIIIKDIEGNIIPVVNNSFVMPMTNVTIEPIFERITNPATNGNILIIIVTLVCGIIGFILLKKRKVRV